jgi:sporulation protein YlmC with PRC-barrel domain
MWMLRLEDIIGIEVLSSDAKVVGTVEGVAVDTENWRVGALKIMITKGVEANLNVKKPLFGAARTAFHTDRVDSIKDVAKLKDPLTKLAQFTIDPSVLPTSAGDLINKRVVSNNGREIGITESLYLEPEASWRVAFIEVEVEKEAFNDMKLKKAVLKKREVKLPTSLVGTVGDLIMLNTSEEELGRILEKSPR